MWFYVDLVFCHPGVRQAAGPLKLVRRFKQALDRAGVHQITFHELRHTFGRRMAAAGTPMRTLQYWMGGHADSKTTQVYAHYQPSHEADAVDRAFSRNALMRRVHVHVRATVPP